MKKIDDSAGLEALRLACAQIQVGAAAQIPREILATAVRYTLQLISQEYPGRAVELRVPPFGAVQIREGINHRRGTPGAVIEMTGEIWLSLATGALSWGKATQQNLVQASGQRTDLSGMLPLLRLSADNSAENI